MNIFSLFKRKKKKAPQQEAQPLATSQVKKEVTVTQSDLDKNIEQLQKEFQTSSDVIIRRFPVNTDTEAKIAIVHIDGISDTNIVTYSIMEPLQRALHQQGASELTPVDLINELYISDLKEAKDWNDAIFHILCGDTAIFMHDSQKIFIGGTRGGDKRSVAEPTTETVVRGPKDAFTENIRTNTGLIRSRIRSPHLKMEAMQLGTVTQTDIVIVYIDNIVEQSLLQEVKKRLKSIEIDEILESGYVESFIKDNKLTPFPTVAYTERPDAVVGNIMEGRIGIIINGTPFVLIAPALFVQFFQSPEDYYLRYEVAIFVRLLRTFTFCIALLAPAIYVALITHHQSMMPTALLISLAAQREGIALPAVVEAFVMEFSFEILREAGLRMPRAIGQAVSIVGALVLGQAVVQAGIVSVSMIIIVSVTAISTFTLPAYAITNTLRLLRFSMIIMASLFGLYGITLEIIFIILHMCSLTSFGIPYLRPISPLVWNENKDTFIRLPIPLLKRRPIPASKQNPYHIPPEGSDSDG